MLFTLAEGKRALRIFLESPAFDSTYQLTARPDWNTKTKIVKKETHGFVLRFSDPAPPEGGIVNIEVPGYRIYTAEQFVREQRRRLQEEWHRFSANVALPLFGPGLFPAGLSSVPAPVTPTHHFLVSTSRKAIIRRLNRELTQAIEARRQVQTVLNQAPVAKPAPKKKKPVKNARLKALIDATVGG